MKMTVQTQINVLFKNLFKIKRGGRGGETGVLCQASNRSYIMARQPDLQTDAICRERTVRLRQNLKPEQSTLATLVTRTPFKKKKLSKLSNPRSYLTTYKNF